MVLLYELATERLSFDTFKRRETHAYSLFATEPVYAK